MRVNTEDKSSLECISSERTPPHKAFGRRKQTFPNRSDYPVQGMFQRFGRKSTLSKMSCRRRTGMGKRLLRHDFSEGFQGKSRFPDAVTQSREDPKKNQTALSGSSFLPDSLKTGFRAARENAPPLRLKLPFSSANGFFRKASGTADRKALPKGCFEESDEDRYTPVLFSRKDLDARNYFHLFPDRCLYKRMRPILFRFHSNVEGRPGEPSKAFLQIAAIYRNVAEDDAQKHRPGRV